MQGQQRGIGSKVSAPTHPGRLRQQVERAAQEGRSALIDVSGNNRLLFIKATAATKKTFWSSCARSSVTSVLGQLRRIVLMAA